MSIDLSDEDVSRLVVAIDHYEAYLRSQTRDDTAYRQLAERLHAIKKPAGSETRSSTRKVKGR